uniref:UNC93-like protein n=1 Tax=Angiostrongylus cantonensis TaxID=6313 RepID=A0A0K0D361_ANGCA
MLISLVCAIAYSIILKILWEGDLMKMTSYKLMFVLGVFDAIQCIPHFTSGIFTIMQTVFHPALSKMMGALATSSYIAYVTLTMVLSFNRLAMWMGSVVILWLGYVICLSTPWVTINYIPERDNDVRALQQYERKYGAWSRKGKAGLWLCYELVHLCDERIEYCNSGSRGRHIKKIYVRP